ncbi:MAG: DUF2599 domain-containing protein [Culicoidibacterales bacterium]
MNLKRFFLMLGVLITFAFSGLYVAAQSTDKPIEVTVVYGSLNPDEIIFDDHTKLSEYEYTMTTLITPRFYPLGDYFDYVGWTNRDDGISLQLKPNNTTRNNNAAKNNAWRTLSSRTHGLSGHSYWKNTQVMEWQFECHYQFAKAKQFWNLEPRRTAPNYAFVVATGCNPGK